MNEAYNRDCVEGMASLPDECIDLTVTSPPYDNMREYHGYTFDYQKTLRELHRITKCGGVVIWVVGDQTVNGSETGTSFRQALCAIECGFNLHDTMIYQKINYVPLTHNRYEQSFEYMFVFSKGRPKTFNPIMIPCKQAGRPESYGQGRRRQIEKGQAMRSPEETRTLITKAEKIHPNIFAYTCGASRNLGHPAVFPYQLAADCIRSWSNENDIVFDPFLGSGTTRVAAYELGRQFIGYEIDKAYFDKQEARFKKHTQQISLFTSEVEDTDDICRPNPVND